MRATHQGFSAASDWLLRGPDAPRVVEAIGAREIFAIHIPRPDAPRAWWGDEGSLEGTVAALERLDGVTALARTGMHWLEYETGRNGMIPKRVNQWPEPSPPGRSSSSGS
jgi:hypothetical protein